MAIPNQFLRRRSTIAFFTEEDTAFAYKSPAATDALVTVDPIDLNQTLNFTDLNEVGTRLLNTQSVLNYGERTDTSFQVISKIQDKIVQLFFYENEYWYSSIDFVLRFFIFISIWQAQIKMKMKSRLRSWCGKR